MVSIHKIFWFIEESSQWGMIKMHINEVLLTENLLLWHQCGFDQLKIILCAE